MSALPLAAAEAPVEPTAPELPQLLQIGREAQAPYEVAASWRQRIRWLDPAVFTDISPVTIPEVGIRLPADQEE